MKLVARAQDLTEDQDILGQTGCEYTTFAAKPNVAELDVAKDIDRLDLTGGEEMEAVRIVLLLVHFQHPTVWVALNTEEKNFHQKQNLANNLNLRIKGSSMSMVVPSPASPTLP